MSPKNITMSQLKLIIIFLLVLLKGKPTLLFQETERKNPKKIVRKGIVVKSDSALKYAENFFSYRNLLILIYLINIKLFWYFIK